MKCCPKDSRVSTYNDLIHTFDKEITFFQTIAPALKEFGLGHINNLIPECFGTGKIDGELVVCLRDFTELGYAVTGKEEFHDVEQVKTVMKALAKFHGASIAARVVSGKLQ